VCGRRGADVRPTPLRAPHQARRRSQRDTFHSAGTNRCPVRARSRFGRYVFRRSVFASHRYPDLVQRTLAHCGKSKRSRCRSSTYLRYPARRASGWDVILSLLHERLGNGCSSEATIGRRRLPPPVLPNPSLRGSTACSAARGWTRRPAGRPSWVPANKNGPPALRRWQPGGHGD
jgi:hypothetical protein